MSVQHNIQITNGKGSLALANGNYTITAEAFGYNPPSLDPSTIEIIEGKNEYSFTISATGTLTLHITDDGTAGGVPIEGATFYRCDAEGNTYGDIITSNADGDAIFNNVPYSADVTPLSVYFKQVSSDGEHTFNAELQNTTLQNQEVTLQISNPDATERTFTFTDKNYANLPIANGKLIAEG